MITMKAGLIVLTAAAAAMLSIGLAGTASAEPADDAMTQGLDGGHPVVVFATGRSQPQRCMVITTRVDRRDNHGGPESNEFNRIFIDAYCPPDQHLTAHPAERNTFISPRRFA